MWLTRGRNVGAFAALDTVEHFHLLTDTIEFLGIAHVSGLRNLEHGAIEHISYTYLLT